MTFQNDRTGPSAATFRWCPIRSLAPRHRARILTHLQALDEADRHLRFGYAASDSHIGRYVDQLDFDRDEVYGVFNRRLELVAMAHLAYLGQDTRHPTSAEFGVSVLPKLRGRGIGARLFERAALHARNQGIDTIIIHALSENRPMLHIVREAGALIETQGPESTARLKLPPEDVGSQLQEILEIQAAAFDYGIKVQARQVGHLLDALRPPAGSGPQDRRSD